MLRRLLVAILFMFTAPALAVSQKLVVDSLEDFQVTNPTPTQCTLREAMEAVLGNLKPEGCDINNGPPLITFEPGLTGTVNLIGPLPVVTKSMEIRGNGADNIGLTGAGQFRVLEIVGDADFTLRDIRIEFGTAFGQANGFGGAVFFNDVSGNNLIEKTRFLSNFAELAGGAVAYRGGGSLSIVDSEFTNNESIVLSAPVGTNPDVRGGGGLYIEPVGAEIEIRRVTFDSNHATGLSIPGTTEAIGGGLLVNPGPGSTNSVSVLHSTFVFNRAIGSGGAVAVLGAIRVPMQSVSIVSNRADSNLNSSGFGGGVAIGQQAQIQLENSVLSKNGAASFIFITNANNCSGPVASGGHNFLGTDNFQVTVTGCGTPSPSDIVGFDAGLTPMPGYNGGFGKTLLPGNNSSPVVNAGICTEREDQNLVALPQGNDCDMGAAERP